jgi:hypothetical protein
LNFHFSSCLCPERWDDITRWVWVTWAHPNSQLLTDFDPRKNHKIIDFTAHIAKSFNSPPDFVMCFVASGWMLIVASVQDNDSDSG